MSKFLRLAAATLCAAAAPALASEKDRDPITLDTGFPQTEGQKAYDAARYVVVNEILPAKKSIAGHSIIEFVATTDLSVLELDFDGAFKISSVTQGGAAAKYRRTANKLFVDLPAPVAKGARSAVKVDYAGKPREAPRAPWDGGFVWATTPSGKPWIATAIQGEGCDVWFPCKDHPLGEPAEGFELVFTVPPGVEAVSNGVLEKVDTLPDGRRAFHWRTRYSTNIYGVALNVGPYALLEDSYPSLSGVAVPVKFWPLAERKEKAEKLFNAQFSSTIEFFERVLGPYPWPDEKIGVVETPHKGMEHQTVNAYGNEYARGILGFDELFQHEFAHEWFGNLLSVSSNSDMWLHEGTGAYMQPVYAQEVIGDAAMISSMYNSYLGIRNCAALAPREEMSENVVYDNDKAGPGSDIYVKGAWVLHSMRYLMGEEPFWRAVRTLLYSTPEPHTLKPPYQPVFRTSDDFLRIASDEANTDLTWFFDVYVRQPGLPELIRETDGADLVLRWKTPGDLPFPMPIPVRIDGVSARLEAPGGVARIAGGAQRRIEIDPMLSVLRVLPSLKTCEERKTAEKAAQERAKKKKG